MIGRAILSAGPDLCRLLKWFRRGYSPCLSVRVFLSLGGEHLLKFPVFPSLVIRTSPKGRREGKNILNHDAERVTWEKREKSTLLPGSLFSASLGRWNRDPGCGWSRDHLSIQNRRVGWYSSTFGRANDKIHHPPSRFFYHPDSGWFLGGHLTRERISNRYN